MDRWEMMQLFLGTTDAQAEVSGQLVLQSRAGDGCPQLAFLHCALATFTHSGIEEDYALLPSLPDLSSLGRWVVRKPSLWSCSGCLR